MTTTTPKPATIITRLLNHWNIPNLRQLANHLEVDPRSISQYRKRETSDIQTRIIHELLTDIEYMEKQIETLKLHSKLS